MSYRNDSEALHTHHDHLVRQLADLDGKLGALAALSDQRERLARELAALRADLDAEAARRAPVRLANLRVASPCRERWDAMPGDDQARHCGRCDKDVFHLSEMTTADAEALLARHGTSICVRFYRRADGTVKTRDCVDRRARVVGVVAAGVMAAAGAVGAVVTSTAPCCERPPALTEVVDVLVVDDVPPPTVPLAPDMGSPPPEMGPPPPPPHDVEILGGL